MMLFVISYAELKAHLEQRAAFWSTEEKGIVNTRSPSRPDQARTGWFGALAKRLKKPTQPDQQIELTLEEFESLELGA